MKVKIRGEVYETVRDAAKAFNVSTSYIYDAIERGREDVVGMGIGRKKDGKYNGNEVVLHGVTFPSMTAASLSLGFNRHYIRSAGRTNSKVSAERIRMAVFKYISKMETQTNDH